MPSCRRENCRILWLPCANPWLAGFWGCICLFREFSDFVPRALLTCFTQRPVAYHVCRHSVESTVPFLNVSLTQDDPSLEKLEAVLECLSMLIHTVCLEVSRQIGISVTFFVLSVFARCCWNTGQSGGSRMMHSISVPCWNSICSEFTSELHFIFV